MESIKRAIRFQILDSKKSIIVFWAVILTVDIAFYFINLNGGANFIVGMSDGINGIRLLSVIGSNLMAISIYIIVYNYVMYYEIFPIAISFSVTRGDFFRSLIINNIFVTFIFSIIQGILMKVDPIFVRAIGREPILDFTIFNVNTDNIIFIVFSLFVVFLTSISIFNLLAALNYRFGYKIWIVFGVIFTLLVFGNMEIVVGNAIEEFFGSILKPRLGLLKIVKVCAFTAVCYTLGYLLTINTNIKGKAI